MTDPAFPLLRRAADEVGVRAWAVGGYVRDTLLGREHPDLDVVVEQGRALEVAGRFAELAGARRPALFPRFGTAQVTWGDRVVEFASARAESYAPDSRKPFVRPASVEEDLLRRDFTVNAMLMDFEGRPIDPLGGRADLERRLLRTPRPAEITFSDDPLRMLRAVRFAAQLDFHLAPDLLPTMRRLRERARPPVVSVERVRDELRKMLLSSRPRLALELLDEGGLLEMLLPEVHACHGVAQGGYHVADVFGHTLLAVEKAAEQGPPDLVLRLAVLLHDVGKPPTATPDGAFHGHHEVGAALARQALVRLRFANADVERGAAPGPGRRRPAVDAARPGAGGHRGLPLPRRREAGRAGGQAPGRAGGAPQPDADARHRHRRHARPGAGAGPRGGADQGAPGGPGPRRQPAARPGGAARLPARPRGPVKGFRDLGGQTID